jgi:hypothetical protein
MEDPLITYTRSKFSKTTPIRDEGIVRMAGFLNEAWRKYQSLFGEAPHGTVNQLAAMLQLCPQAKEAIRLFEKQQEERMTV